MYQNHAASSSRRRGTVKKGTLTPSRVESSQVPFLSGPTADSLQGHARQPVSSRGQIGGRTRGEESAWMRDTRAARPGPFHCRPANGGTRATEDIVLRHGTDSHAKSMLEASTSAPAATHPHTHTHGRMHTHTRCSQPSSSPPHKTSALGTSSGPAQQPLELLPPVSSSSLRRCMIMIR
ncbi:uncharacterized protein EI97DRAFT_162437 [Westerdykella ornata]|uniref:Uncharacterized protein n=1 Tax=Westerdykella ornata TaxID=318751 RepID=A0A6A6JAT0_WESOR|nr:uncharacterized protein EI97DRAFT_162437 [Westerdykella ornata]KAF2273367.1 hypothetical protein EI97DRAFT_162437 [Westerdykella ornata]